MSSQLGVDNQGREVVQPHSARQVEDEGRVGGELFEDEAEGDVSVLCEGVVGEEVGCDEQLGCAGGG